MRVRLGGDNSASSTGAAALQCVRGAGAGGAARGARPCSQAGMQPSPPAPRNPDAAFKPLRRVCRVVCTFFYIPVLLLNPQ